MVTNIIKLIICIKFMFNHHNFMIFIIFYILKAGNADYARKDCQPGQLWCIGEF